MITLWDEKADLIQPEDTQGKDLAVPATIVPVWDKKNQFESTTSTTVEVDSDITHLQVYIDR